MLRIVAHIPAREGSKRLAEKNLLTLSGAPLVSYAIRIALGSKLINDVYINTESAKIGEVGKQFGAKLFKRDSALSHDDVTQDTFNYDFITKMSPDILVLVNPVCPLITSDDIDNALKKFLSAENADCLVSVTNYNAHVLIDEKPVNFQTTAILPRTQDISPVTVINWAFGIWNAHSFKKQFESKGHACIFGKTLWYEIPKSRSVKINDQDDFDLAEAVIRSRGVQ